MYIRYNSRRKRDKVTKKVKNVNNENTLNFLLFDIYMFGCVDFHILVYHLLQSTGKLKQYIFYNGIPFEFL